MPKHRLKSEMNVVPYIDVMLVLLVIFMVAAPLINTGSIDLPKVGHSNPIKQNLQPLKISVSKDQQFSVEDPIAANTQAKKIQGMKELRKIVLSATQVNPKRAVVIAGDKEVAYKNILAVMDELKNARVHHVGLLVNSK